MNKLLNNIFRKHLFLILSLFALFGCNAPKKHLEKFDNYIASGNVEKARCFAKDKIHEKGSPRGEDLLWSLQLGSIERFENHLEQSTYTFDTCEDIMTHFDAENSGIGHTVGSVAVNDNIVPYTGQVYDGVMVNTYKAFNFMAMGMPDLARVEFNRALDRQRRAKETFNKEIQELRDETAQNENSALVQKTLDNPQFQNQLSSTYSTLEQYIIYPDFVNPFATYAAGVFFTIDGDYDKAIDLFKESAGMLPENSFVTDDFKALENALDHGTAFPRTVWVFFENGLGPVKTESRIDLPLFIATDDVRYVGIALPQLEYRPAPVPYFDVQSPNGTLRTQFLANMDSVVKTEFDKEFPAILTRAILSATAKAIAQAALEKNQDSSTAAVFAALYSFATTAADVRIWTMLPKNIQLARLPIPADGAIELLAPGRPAIPVQIPDCNYAVVYVRIINDQLGPNIEIMAF